MVVVALIFIFPLGIDPFLWVAFFAPSFASDGGFDPSVFGVVFYALSHFATGTRDTIIFGHPVRFF